MGRAHKPIFRATCFVGTSRPRQAHPASIDVAQIPPTLLPAHMPALARHPSACHKVEAERCARLVVGPAQRSRQVLHSMA
jgi:hypothetical protein